MTTLTVSRPRSLSESVRESVGTADVLVQALDRCSARGGGCEGCVSARACLRLWFLWVDSSDSANGIKRQAQRIEALEALPGWRLQPGEALSGKQSLHHRDEYLCKPPHKTHRQRKQHDPLEQAAVSARQEAVVP